MRSGLIVHKAKDKLISESFIEAIFKTHGQGMGVAQVNDGEVDNLVYLEGDPVKDNKGEVIGEINLHDEFVSIQEQLKDKDVFFYFLHIEENDPFDADLDMQPFNILTRSGQGKEDDKVLLSIMLDIDSTRLSKGEEPGFSEEYHLVNKYLGEKIRACNTRNSGDLAAVCKELASDVTKTEILAMTDNRGDVLFIPAKGPAFAHHSNDMARDYSWGRASKHLDVPTDLDKEPAKVVDINVKPKSLRDRKLSLKAEEPKKEVEAKPDLPKDKPKEVEKEKDQPRFDPDKVNPEDKSGPGASFRLVQKEGQEWVEYKEGQPFAHMKNSWHRNTAMPRPGDEKLVQQGFPSAALRIGSPIYLWKEDMARANGINASAFRTAFDKAAKEFADKEAKAKAAVDSPLVIPVEDKKKLLELAKENGLFGFTAEQLAESLKEAVPFSQAMNVDFDRFWGANNPRLLYRMPKSTLIALVLEKWVKETSASLAPAEKKEETVVAPTAGRSLRDRNKRTA